MRYLYLSALFFVSFYLKAQSNVEFETFPTDCGTNTGIVIVKPNYPYSKIIWPSGFNYTDSIAYNLSYGFHVIKIEDLNGNLNSYGFSIYPKLSCFDTDLDFYLNSEGEGFIKVLNRNRRFDFEWDFGDGIKETGKDNDDYSYHKYQSPGNYTVKLKIFKPDKEELFSKSILIPNWTSSLEGLSTIEKPTQPYLSISETHHCGGKTFVIGSNTYEDTKKIFFFNELDGVFNELPIDEIYLSHNKIPNNNCFNNKLYFTGRIANSGYELCETDGTVSGTKISAQYDESYYQYLKPNNITIFQNDVYFTTTHFRAPSIMSGLFKFSNGQLYEIDGSGDYISNNKVISQLNGKLIISNSVLRAYDGYNFTNLIGANTNPFSLDVVNGNLFFTLPTPQGRSLWKTDGTVNGTTLVKYDIPYEIQKYKAVGDKLFFSISSNTYEDELWVSDGTDVGTIKLKKFNKIYSSTTINDLNVYQNKLIFIVNHFDAAGDLYESDGSASGTIKLVDYEIFTSFYLKKHINVVNDELFFSANNFHNFNFLSKKSQKVRFTCSGLSQPTLIDYFISSSNRVFCYSNNYGVIKIFEVCKYNIPKLMDNQSFRLSNLELSTSSQNQLRWINNINQCLVNNFINPRNFYVNETQNYMYSIINNMGCETRIDTLKIYSKILPDFAVLNTARCDNQFVKIKYKITRNFNPNNLFSIQVRVSANSPKVDIPSYFDNGEFTGLIPQYLQNEGLIFNIKSSSPEITFDDYTVPSISYSNQTSILGTKFFQLGDSCTVSILSNGNAPYSFRINGNDYFSNNRVNYIKLKPVVSTIFELTNAQNSCGTSNIGLPIVSFQLSRCFNQINQAGMLSSGQFNAINEVVLSGIAQSNQNIEYSSEKNINLINGFFAPAGTVFKVEVKKCID